ncbi:hypothetical protein BDE27_0628 [Xenorhabdus ehlersii]|uniref:Uncharacterized protein n=1 Tax=Xenorhabdus ehlersii TaxID=290111 RepID=A0A2D0IRE8_9GAMM|nr:hypothetical protein Xehl_02106 [Xenorhabdus ehlersii]PHM24956.1 hypothetical protein Xehl_01741 [Xenorhabdus ehlersii]RKE87952.1 hypothetical protein BDE27_3498 [Xenorhabdus ehlersii]RKE92955.1 hypothetical protein BDE27_0628 [Xenorhabdus ehlersii]
MLEWVSIVVISCLIDAKSEILTQVNQLLI